jgi:hypothetical protein
MTSEEYGELLEAIRQEGQAAGVAHAIAYAESMAKALGEAGEVVRAEEWQDLVRELREGDSGRSLTRLIAEKQAEALEAFAKEVAGVRDVEEHDGHYTEDECRAVVVALEAMEAFAYGRAAAYRKGGAP